MTAAVRNAPLMCSDTAQVNWYRDQTAVWHRVLGWVQWGDDERWTPLTACQAARTAHDFGPDALADPARKDRCRKCDVAVVRVDLPDQHTLENHPVELAAAHHG